MSSQGLKALFSTSAMYAVANLLQRGMMLILLPIYARHFSKAEFGAMDLLYQGILVLIIVSSFGMPQGLPRGIHQEKATEEDGRRLLGVLTLFILPVTAITFALIWSFSDPIAAVLFNEQGEGLWVRLGAAFFVAMVIQQYPLQIFKAYQRSLQYSLWSIGTFLIATACNLYFIVVMDMGLVGMLIANTIGFGVTGVIAFVCCLKFMKFNADWHRLRPLLEFGLPMLPALLGRKILEASDRYMLPQYHSMDTLGEYVMGAKVANIVEVMVLVPFLFAWQPFFYSVANRADAKNIFARVTLYFLGVSAMVFMGMYILHGSVLDFIGNGDYSTSSVVVQILVLAALLNGIQYTISPGIHIKNKLVQESSIMIAAAFLNVGLNFLFIPPYGAQGAAISTLISYLAYLICTFSLSQIYYPVNYHWRRMTQILVTAIAFMAMIYWMDNILVQLCLVFVFILLGPVLDLYMNERDVLNAVLQKLRRKTVKGSQ